MLSDQHAALAQVETGDKLLITTVFRAKGLEWEHVFIPNCNDEIVPYKHSENPEEERRLLYVAITRAKFSLYIDFLKDEPPTPFLVEAQAAKIIQSVEMISNATRKAPTEWDASDLRAIAIHAPRLQLDRYFSHWWSASTAVKESAAQQILGCYQAIRARGLWEKLGLREEDQQRWLQLPPTATTLYPFPPPAFEQWLDEVEKRLQTKRPHPLKRVRKVVEAPVSDAKYDVNFHAAPSKNQWQRGDRVNHPNHGSGIITTISGMTGEIWVKFEGAEVPRVVKKGELRRG